LMMMAMAMYRTKAISDIDDDDVDDDGDGDVQDEGNQRDQDDEISGEGHANPLLETERIRIEMGHTELNDEAESLPQDAKASNEGTAAEEGDGESTSDEEESVPDPPPQSAASKKGPAPLPRGKRAKAKRIASKYKDQDEEDRLAAQALIGSTVGREKAAAETAVKAKREAELTFQKERRRAQHQRTLKETAEHEEVRKLMLDEGIEMLDDAEAQKATSLDIFVGTPLPGDEIIDAIPVCAPWNAMGKYKYKVKLQPGPVKKGKAVKEVLGRWVAAADSAAKAKVIDTESRDPERMWPREVELIRGWKAEECINVVPVGKVRVMMAGGAAGASAPKGAPKGKGKGAGRGKGKR